MSQNRKPPAYQEYAGEILSSMKFRLMPLEGRGLWWTLRLECWQNIRLPSSPEELSILLNVDDGVVRETLPTLIRYGEFQEIEGGWLICPALEDYRKYLADRRQRQSEGGKAGSALTNAKRASNKPARKQSRNTAPNQASDMASNSTSNPTSNSTDNTTSISGDSVRDSRRGQGESLVQLSSVQQSTDKPSCNQGVEDQSTDEWLKSYEEPEPADWRDF